MALSNVELTEKYEAIINQINKMQVAMLNLGSKAQLRQLTLLLQKDIDDLKTRVALLEEEVVLLKSQQ